MWLEILNAIWNIFEDSLRIEFLVDNMLFWNQGKILWGVLNLKCIWLLEIYLERKCINKTEQEKKSKIAVKSARDILQQLQKHLHEQLCIGLCAQSYPFSYMASNIISRKINMKSDRQNEASSFFIWLKRILDNDYFGIDILKWSSL